MQCWSCSANLRWKKKSLGDSRVEKSNFQISSPFNQLKNQEFQELDQDLSYPNPVHVFPGMGLSLHIKSTHELCYGYSASLAYAGVRISRENDGQAAAYQQGAFPSRPGSCGLWTWEIQNNSNICMLATWLLAITHFWSGVSPYLVHMHDHWPICAHKLHTKR